MPAPAATPTDLDHAFWMAQALRLAQDAAARGEIPVGALIVHHPPGGPAALIAAGHNLREAEHDPSAHAEIVALRLAGKTLGRWRLTDCTLYVTLEPCAMCAGAIVQARLPRLVYGCRDPKAGAVDTLFQLCSDPRLNHRAQIISGILAEPAAALLQKFFAQRRTPRPPPQPPAGPHPELSPDPD